MRSARACRQARSCYRDSDMHEGRIIAGKPGLGRASGGGAALWAMALTPVCAPELLRLPYAARLLWFSSRSNWAKDKSTLSVSRPMLELLLKDSVTDHDEVLALDDLLAAAFVFGGDRL